MAISTILIVFYIFFEKVQCLQKFTKILQYTMQINQRLLLYIRNGPVKIDRLRNFTCIKRKIACTFLQCKRMFLADLTKRPLRAVKGKTHIKCPVQPKRDYRGNDTSQT